MRLDDGNLSWTDLHAFIYSSPPSSAYFNSVEKGWDSNTHGIADLFDMLHILVWQHTPDAQQKFPRHRPKPRPRPGDENKPEVTVTPLMGGIGGMTASVMPVQEFNAKVQEHRRRVKERRDARGN